MSLLSLSLFASVCLIIEPIHVIFVRLYVIAGAQCETRPISFRAGGSHCVCCLFCWLIAQTRSHLLCASVSLSLSSGCAAFWRRGLCKRSPSMSTDVPCLCVCVCVWLHPSVAPLLSHPSVCPLPADFNQISDTGASALAAALNGSQLKKLVLGEYFEPFGD